MKSSLSLLDEHCEAKNDDKLNIVQSTVRELNTDTDETKHVSIAVINRELTLCEISNSSPTRAPIGHSRKKLLILDVNGLLADVVCPPPKDCKADKNIARRASKICVLYNFHSKRSIHWFYSHSSTFFGLVFVRPFCSDFLKFCFERFDVAIWSSRKKNILERVTEFLLGDLKDKLIFCYNLSHCTPSGFKTLENKHKDLVFKDLRRIWEKHDPGLPWENGDYNESNTVLLDDSPYKALINPPHTTIFPYAYKYMDRNDNALGSGGDLRVYLEGLAEADNIQKYIEKNPLGQSAINETHPSWDFYLNVINTVSSVSTTN